MKPYSFRTLCTLVLSGGLAVACSSDSEKVDPLDGHALGDKERELIFESAIETLDGQSASLADYEGKALLLVNVASECGFTPQYEGLQELQEEFGERGFSVLGFPCNQFAEQEPGSPEEIRSFCKTNYGVTFPLFEKIKVNGDDRHPIYRGLVPHADAEGEAGEIQWNFEKFLISADRERIYRFRSKTEPKAPVLVATLEAALP